MIFFDTTNSAGWRHASGLRRVSRRLLQELGSAAVSVSWPDFEFQPTSHDWIFTPELFSETERPGFSSFLAKRHARLAAIYHDSIPLKFPAITWPASVARHPSYLKLLSRFDRVWAVSEASRQELLQIWHWQGVTTMPSVTVLPLGADGMAVARETSKLAGGQLPRVVAVGILEPRKNQALLLDAFEALREEGLNFELHLVGRANPHFGTSLLRRVQEVAGRTRGLYYHSAMRDGELLALLRSARCTAFPSIAEGCGLPVLESLWMGVPCVCSDIAPVRENAAGGGCEVVPGNSLEGWCHALRRVLTDDRWYAELARQASTRPLPTWRQAAQIVRQDLVGPEGLPS